MRPDEGVVARRYARALMMLCKERKDAESVGESISAFSAALEQLPALRNTLESPLLTRTRKKQILEGVFAEVTIPSTAKGFLLLLVQHGRLEFLSACSKRFGELLDAEAGRIRASVATPKALNESQKSDMVMALTRLYRQRVLAGFKVEESLLGGVRVQVGNLVMDSSIKGKLRKLRQQISSNV